MKLELDKSEVEAVLLNYAAAIFPGAFNRVEIDPSYVAFRGATFSKAAPAVTEPIIADEQEPDELLRAVA